MMDETRELGVLEPSAPAAAVWSPAEVADLAAAVAALERSSFATRVGGLVGRQIGVVGDMIPVEMSKLANAAALKALSYAMRAALATMSNRSRAVSPKWHMAAVAASGAVGGAFGLATLPIELPVSTALMLRAIAAIAQHEGEDLSDPAAAVACIEVFALGAGHDIAPVGQSSYFASRMLIAKSVTEAARYLVQRGLMEESAPVLLRLMGQVASRFGLVVTQKIFAQSVPVIGAAAGAAINAVFMDHYQALARGHFVVRRLERQHGKEAVRTAYERIQALGVGSGAPAAKGAEADADKASLARSVV